MFKLARLVNVMLLSSVFLNCCQVNFLISCNLGQCPPNTIIMAEVAHSLSSYPSPHPFSSVNIPTNLHIFIFSPNSPNLKLDHWLRRTFGTCIHPPGSPALHQTRQPIPCAVYSPPLPWSWFIQNIFLATYYIAKTP